MASPWRTSGILLYNMCAPSACHFLGIVPADSIVQGRTRKKTPSSADSYFLCIFTQHKFNPHELH
jgi:hypothetical protein